MAGRRDLFTVCVFVSCLLCWSEAIITSLNSTANGETTTETQEGCEVVLTCSGTGDAAPIWRVFGTRVPLTTNGNIQVINPVVVSPGPVEGMLSFRPIALSDAGAYTCTIGQTTRTIRLTVNGAVTLTPGNMEYDISDHDVGRYLAVLCVVQTCLSDVTVAVRRGTTVLKERPAGGDNTRSQFNLVVGDDLPGEHNCHATFNVNQQAMTVSSMPFNITGTPNIPPSTSAPNTNRNGAPGMVSSVLTFIVFAVTIFLALLN